MPRPGYKPTSFPGGTNIKRAICSGGTAGSHTIDSSFGVAVGDAIQQVIAITIGTDGTLTTALDLTSEFTDPVATASTVSNASGTNTTGAILEITFADVSAGTASL